MHALRHLVPMVIAVLLSACPGGGPGGSRIPGWIRGPTTTTGPSAASTRVPAPTRLPTPTVDLGPTVTLNLDTSGPVVASDDGVAGHAYANPAAAARDR